MPSMPFVYNCQRCGFEVIDDTEHPEEALCEHCSGELLELLDYEANENRSC
jgi:DNA-directed RNA polymerase subunit RPC12/RpoP